MQKLSNGLPLNRAIQDQVKEYITRNRLRPDDLLPPEGQLALSLGVSRGSVREAIKALESLGIVEVRHGDGVRVRRFNLDPIFNLLSFGVHFDPDRIVELLHIRIWLEDSAVVDATQRIHEATLAEMQALLPSWEAKARTDADTSNEDRAFHALLYRELNNESLTQLIDIFWTVYHALPPVERGVDEDPVATFRAHEELLDAIVKRDPLLARERMRRHFRGLEERIQHAAARLSESRLAKESV